ncbi:hypothetical protein DSO57_1029553 [Entomophthora muscae]|uniref:Uncharacterized protein n=1 Tax=Entomophthora muscae TaxID=34485 RepID=A0ACC2SQM8_9FUNG|nr:hypothetical protein DSO57_1029553 [Entomophthora muscae]
MGLVPVFQTNLHVEVSCLALLAKQKLIVAGTYLPSIRLIEMDGTLRYELDLRQYQSPELSTPHSILYYSESSTLLAGLTDGTVLCFSWDGALVIKERWDVGYLPATLSFMSESQVLVVSDTISLILFGPQGSSVDPLLFPRQISLLGAIAFPPAASRPGTLGLIHAGQIDKCEFSLFATSVEPSPAPHALKLNVQGTPKRLHHNNTLASIVVLVSEPVRGTSALQGLDPSTGAVRCTFRFSPGEVAYCFLHWDAELACRQNPLRPKPIPRHSLYFVGIKTHYGGAILSLLLKVNDIGDLVFSRVGYYPTDKMVYCLEQFSGDFLAAGSSIHLSVFYPSYDNGLQDVTLENKNTRSVGAEILALSASQQTLAVATQPFSLFFFRLDETKSLNFANSGRYSRRVVSCIQLDDTLGLGCDRVGGSLFGLRLDSPGAKAPEGDIHWKVQPGATEFFSFYLGEGATRLRKVDSSSWAAIGCTMLGTVFTVSPLPHDTLGPLLKLQKVLAAFPLTRPLLGNDYHLHRQQSSMSPSAVVIDGWMLSQFLSLNLDQQRQLVASSPLLSSLIPHNQINGSDTDDSPSLDSLISFLRGLIQSLNTWPL